jgi:hypothetical protein
VDYRPNVKFVARVVWRLDGIHLFDGPRRGEEDIRRSVNADNVVFRYKEKL